MLTVTKIFEFSYGHHLPDYKGPCVHPHGHNGRLEIEVGYGGLLVNGMVMDFVDLKKIVKEEVLDTLDHSYVNDYIEMPTAENMILWIVDKLQKRLKGLKFLVRVRLWETSTSYAEWRSS